MATELQKGKAAPEVAYQDADEFSALLKQTFKPRSERIQRTQADRRLGCRPRHALIIDIGAQPGRVRAGGRAAHRHHSVPCRQQRQ